MMSPTNRLSLPSAFNLATVAVLLWVAIGITCEITTRIEDFGRVSSYQKWLLTCLTNPGQDKTCHPTTDEYAADIRTASTQVRNFHSLNSVGAPDRCSIPTVFSSPIGAFQEDCLKVMSGDPNLEEALVNKQYRRVFDEILQPGWFAFDGPLFALDQRAKEPLYFCLVLVSAAIGSLIAGLRSTGITTLRDVTLGLGAGFAVYILMRGGNFVFVSGAGAAPIDVLNPFTAGAVGFLVGLFNDRVFGLLDGVVRKPAPAATPPATPQAGAPPAAAVAAAVAATNRVAAVAALGAAKSALETAAAKAKSNDPEAPQALSAALSAFQTVEAEVKKQYPSAPAQTGEGEDSRPAPVRGDGRGAPEGSETGLGRTGSPTAA